MKTIIVLVGNNYCEVCYKDISDDNIIYCISCENDFHKSCIELTKIRYCPMCKFKLWEVYPSLEITRKTKKPKKKRTPRRNRSTTRPYQDPERMKNNVLGILVFYGFAALVMSPFILLYFWILLEMDR